MQLSANQQRILGCLLEKQSTTPEHYPLSLNGLTNACNQKSNRDPVLSLTETDVQNALDKLIEMRLVTLDEGLSGRVNKYDHRFCNTEFGNLKFTPQQRAIICVLLLRGPQTPGEIRTRTNRLADFTDVSEVEATLNELQELNGNTLVKKLEREPGKRDSRYIHLLSDINELNLAESNTLQPGDNSTGNQPQLVQRVAELEKQVAVLSEQVSCLTELLEDR